MLPYSTGALTEKLIQGGKKMQKAEFFRDRTWGPPESESSKSLSTLPVLNFLEAKIQDGRQIARNEYIIRTKNCILSCNTSFYRFSGMRNPFLALF